MPEVFWEAVSLPSGRGMTVYALPLPYPDPALAGLGIAFIALFYPGELTIKNLSRQLCVDLVIPPENQIIVIKLYFFLLGQGNIKNGNHLRLMITPRHPRYALLIL